ncbi:MAG: hypothetical protein F6K00_29955 [Leptolyngbya sp. SIOISBB]|nr:hypothetical protein [Leptolyngbya sp. SIOISBB]
MTKSKNIGFRLGVADYERAHEKALVLGHSSPHHFARSLLMREIDAEHCLSNLLERNHQGIITSQQMLTDLAVGLLFALDVPQEKYQLIMAEFTKYQ